MLVHRLGPSQAAAVREARGRGWDIACVSGESAEGVESLSEVPSFEDGAFTPGAFDLVEYAIGELLRRRPHIGRALARATASDVVDRYLCRALLRGTGELLALALLASSPELAGYERVVVERHWPNSPDFALLVRLTRGRIPTLPAAVADALRRLEFETDGAPALLRRLRCARHAAQELVGLWADSLRLLRPRTRRLPRRPLLIRTYVMDWGLDKDGEPRLRNLDFVVDDETIKTAEVGIWLEEGCPADWREQLCERGYAVLSAADVGIGPLRFAIRVVPALARASLLFARLAAAEHWWPGPVRRLLFQTVLWSEVARSARPRAFIAHNDTYPSGVGRTLALRRAGCLTVEYEFSSHWLTTEEAWVPDYVYGFTVVDAMVSWGPLHSAHFRAHRGEIRELWEIGCLWSEHARLVCEDAEIGARYRSRIGVDLTAYRHLVGVFDTSTASFFGADDMVAFYESVAAVARRLPDVLFVCKPKRPLESLFPRASRGREVEALLVSTPNIVLLPKPFETAAVVGLCDLSVSACFTSPAIETVGVLRPALYHDPTGLFPDSFFRRIPGLVSTSDHELRQRIEELLALDQAAREADVRARFAELEGWFDGLAITRMRERLRAALDR